MTLLKHILLIIGTGISGAYPTQVLPTNRAYPIELICCEGGIRRQILKTNLRPPYEFTKYNDLSGQYVQQLHLL